LPALETAIFTGSIITVRQ